MSVYLGRACPSVDSRPPPSRAPPPWLSGTGGWRWPRPASRAWRDSHWWRRCWTHWQPSSHWLWMPASWAAGSFPVQCSVGVTTRALSWQTFYPHTEGEGTLVCPVWPDIEQCHHLICLLSWYQPSRDVESHCTLLLFHHPGQDTASSGCSDLPGCLFLPAKCGAVRLARPRPPGVKGNQDLLVYYLNPAIVLTKLSRTRAQIVWESLSLTDLTKWGKARRKKTCLYSDRWVLNISLVPRPMGVYLDILHLSKFPYLGVFGRYYACFGRNLDFQGGGAAPQIRWQAFGVTMISLKNIHRWPDQKLF